MSGPGIGGDHEPAPLAAQWHVERRDPDVSDDPRKSPECTGKALKIIEKHLRRVVAALGDGRQMNQLSMWLKGMFGTGYSRFHLRSRRESFYSSKGHEEHLRRVPADTGDGDIEPARTAALSHA